MSESPFLRPVAAVGVACLRGDEVLLIKRGKEPLKDRWSLPGGRIEWGETAPSAALRELMEETGIKAEIVGLADVVDAIHAGGGETPAMHYVLIDYAARWLDGAPRAGDDAADARFFRADEIEALGLSRETARVIAAARAMLQAG